MLHGAGHQEFAFSQGHIHCTLQAVGWLFVKICGQDLLPRFAESSSLVPKLRCGKLSHNVASPSGKGIVGILEGVRRSEFLSPL